MALLDVSDILSDPDFMESGLICKRQAQAVGANGRAINTATQTTFSGVVTSNEGSILDRIAEGERIRGSIMIHSRFRLSDGAGSAESADIVVWKGREYTVASVQDYSHFGRGFYSAICDLKPLGG